jgi:hypothetical protein
MQARYVARPSIIHRQQSHEPLRLIRRKAKRISSSQEWPMCGYPLIGSSLGPYTSGTFPGFGSPVNSSFPLQCFNGWPDNPYGHDSFVSAFPMPSAGVLKNLTVVVYGSADYPPSPSVQVLINVIVNRAILTPLACWVTVTTIHQPTVCSDVTDSPCECGGSDYDNDSNAERSEQCHFVTNHHCFT